MRRVFIAAIALAIVGLAGIPVPAAAQSVETVLFRDPAGDVVYSAAYPGSQNHDYIDALEASIAYSALTDTITFRIKVSDSTLLATPWTGWEIDCSLWLQAYANGERVGTLIVGMTVNSTDGRVAHHAGWIKWGTSGPYWALMDKFTRVVHEHKFNLARPGTLEVMVGRPALVGLADSLAKPSFYCGEFYEPAEGPPLVVENSDSVNESGEFSLKALVPAAGPRIPEEPWEFPTGPVAAAIGLGLLVKLAIGWWLHTRVARDQLLDHPVRARIHDILGSNPGIHYRALMKACDTAAGAFAHHLYMLERAGLVRKETFHGFTHYALAGTDTAVFRRVSLARAPLAEWILRQVGDRPGVTANELAKERGVHGSSILYHVRRLVGAGLVERQRTRRGLELRVPTTVLPSRPYVGHGTPVHT